MPPEREDAHNEILRLNRENNELLKQNQVLLKKLYRNDMIGIAFKVVWFAIIVGLPFAVYFYVLEPYFSALGANYETFRLGMAEIPGLKWLEDFITIFAQ